MQSDDGIILKCGEYPKVSLFRRFKLWFWLLFNDPISEDALETIEIEINNENNE